MLETGWLRRLTRGVGVWQLFYYFAIGALFAVGIFFRSQRYWVDPIGLWGDEASWGNRLFHHALTGLQFRPIGYMALSKLAVSVYSNEATLRICSYVAGLASLGITFDLGQHLFRSRTVRLLCLAVVAFHPLLIDMSREFKPYELEFCAHLGLIGLFVRWRARRTPTRLYVLLVAASLSFLLAYNIIFALPAIFALLGGTFLRETAYRKLLLTASAALAALSIMALIYVVIIRGMGSSDSGKSYWGKKYDVFYLPRAEDTGSALANQADWLFHKYAGLAASPGAQRDNWVFPKQLSPGAAELFTRVDWYAWVGLHVLGLAALLLYRRWSILGLLFGSLSVTMVFNVIGWWPFGMFRTNAFLLGYFILIPMIGLDALVTRPGVLGLSFVGLGCLLILGTNLSVGFDDHARKYFFTAHSEMRSVLRRLKALREGSSGAPSGGKTYVLLDWYSCAPLDFYTELSDSTRREFGEYLHENFEFRCTKSAPGTHSFMRQLRQQSFFVIVSDDRAKSRFRDLMHRASTIISEERVRGAQDLYYAIGH